MHFNPSDRERSRLSVRVARFRCGLRRGRVRRSRHGAGARVRRRRRAGSLVRRGSRQSRRPHRALSGRSRGDHPARRRPIRCRLVQADRFLDKRKSDPKLPIDEKWDDSVKALVNYPDVVKMMSGDLDWTSALGEAVVADQGAVLEAIQAFRRRTQAAGNLKSNDKQVVEVEKEVIKIVPAEPGGDLRAAVQPDDRRRRGRAGLGLLPHAVSRLLLPVCAGCGVRDGTHLGRRDRRRMGRRPLGHQLGRRRHQHQSQHEHQHRRHQPGQHQSRQSPARGRRRRQHGVEVGQATGAGERRDRTHEHRRSRVGDAGRGGGGFSGTSGAMRPVDAVRSAAAPARRGANRPSTQQAGGFGGGGAANRAGSVSASPRDNFGGSVQSRRLRERQRAGRLRLRSPDEHGQLARCVEPRLDVEPWRRRRTLDGRRRWWRTRRRWRWRAAAAGVARRARDLPSQPQIDKERTR